MCAIGDTWMNGTIEKMLPTRMKQNNVVR